MQLIYVKKTEKISLYNLDRAQIYRYIYMEKLFNFKDMIILHDLGKVCNCIFMGHIVNTCMYFFLSFVFF